MNMQDWIREGYRRRIDGSMLGVPDVIWLTMVERNEIAELTIFAKRHRPGELFMGCRVSVIDRPPREDEAQDAPHWFATVQLCRV